MTVIRRVFRPVVLGYLARKKVFGSSVGMTSEDLAQVAVQNGFAQVISVGHVSRYDH